MARKSAQQRLNEITQLLNSYSSTEAQFFSWDISFLQSMKARLERKKALTKRMRFKIDELISAGKKEMPATDSRATTWIELASHLPSRESGILIDFASRLARGWKLSEKQEQFANGLVGMATKIKAGDIWKPSEEDLEDMKLIDQLGRTYDRIWLMNNPGAAKALQRINDYLHTDSNSDAKKYFEARHLDYARKKFAAKIRRIKNPKFNAGDFAYATRYQPETRSTVKLPALVVGPAQVSNPTGLEHRTKLAIVFPVLINGDLLELPEEQLKKR